MNTIINYVDKDNLIVYTDEIKKYVSKRMENLDFSSPEISDSQISSLFND